jgi:tetratricopeptide (TPR) repeat protein/DNA-binding XRE family transcriptional regulator
MVGLRIGEMMVTFGHILRTHRLRQGLSQADLAVRAGLAERSVRGIEIGRVRPRPGTVRLLAEALGLAGAELERFRESAGPTGMEPGGVRPVRPRPAQLPHGVVGFAGREAFVAALDALLTDRGPTAVVISALAGTAGVGKTALAVHWAHRVADRFPDGQLFVNLRGYDPSGSVMDPAEALRAFLDALGVRCDQVPGDLTAQIGLYRSLLAARRVLVVLDNARDAEQVRPLLPGAPGCLAVVTSRNDLSGLVAADGARPLTVDLLSVDESRRLLAGRLGEPRVAAEPEAVDELIVGCGRLPLALAVVAARAAGRPDLTLASVAAQVRTAGLDAFSGPDLSTDVRAVIGWSYRSLSEDAARTLRLLGLHPGPDASLAAAASLTGAPPDSVRGWLSELSRAHLLTEPAPGRYAFHDLLRACATELVHTLDAAADREWARRRLVDHYVHTGHTAALLLMPQRAPLELPAASEGAVRLPLATEDEASAWFAAEHESLLAALRAAAGGGHDEDAWRLAWVLVDFQETRGYRQEWIACQRLGLDAARRLGQRQYQALSLRFLGRATNLIGRHDEAERYLRASLGLFAELGDLAAEALTRHALALLTGFQGRHAEALDHAERALAQFQAAQHLAGQARAHNTVGWYLSQLGRHPPAVDQCRQAIAIHQKVGDRHGEACTWDSLGHAYNQMSQHAEALHCFETSLDLLRESVDRYVEAQVRMHQGEAHLGAGDREAARAAWVRALTILEDLADPLAEDVRARLDQLPPR